MKSTILRYKQSRFLQVRGFCYAARAGSISKAAEQMFLSQPTVSLQIQALERDLGATLFERRGPRISLTPDGQILHEMAMPLVEGIDSLDAEFQGRRDQALSRGTVTIAAGGSTIQYVLPEFAKRFMALYPKVDIRMKNVTGKAGLFLLRAGEVDFAVGPLLDIPDDITFYPIVSYEPLLITCRDHPLSTKQRITLADVSRYPLILPPRHLSTWRQVEFVFAEHNLTYEVRLEMGGWEVIKKYVELGLGISIVMSICITGNENLFVASVKKYFPRRIYGVVLRKGKRVSPQAKQFIEVMDPNLKENL